MPYRALSKRVGNTLRLAEVIQVLVKHGFADLLRRAGVYDRLPAKILQGLRLHEAPPGEPHTLASRLRDALTDLGPTFVKFGQILSTRPDLIGQDLCTELGKLQDHVAPLAFEKMRPAIEDGLGARVEELYETFDSRPLASASLSQVYRATLRGGTRVVVKVQRPGMRRVIDSDLNLMRAMAEWSAEHVQDLDWIDLVGAVDEFNRSIHRELDFTIEARVIEQFRKNFQEVDTVFIPRIYADRCAPAVLTMDWIDGVRVDDVAAFAVRNCDPKVVATVGCDALCRQVFEHHFFHADPHPGNILVTRNNQVAFLDYGMVGHLERTDVVAMADLLRAIFNEDSASCVQALLAFTTSGDAEDPARLEHEVAEFIAFDARALIAGGRVGQTVERVTAILRRHRLQLAPRFSLLLKALATIESTGRVLDPALDLVPILRPYVERIIASRYSPYQLAAEGHHHLMALLRLGRQAPQDIHYLLRMLRTGRLRMRLNHEGLNHLAGVADRASNRITFGLITGALIVGSSLLMTQEIGTRTLGMIGYLIAAVLGVALLISILRSKNY